MKVAGCRAALYPLRPQPTRRTSWKLVGNPGLQLVSKWVAAFTELIVQCL